MNFGFLTGILIGGFAGFLIGVILTCILLCKKNLEIYSEISKRADETKNKAVTNFKVAQNVYKQAIDEYENGTPAPTYEDTEEETESTDSEYIDE